MSVKRRLLIAYTLTTIFYHLPAYSSLEYRGFFGSINAGYVDQNSGLINTHRDEVWKVTADFGVNFKEAEFYSFYESSVLNHAVAGCNHTVSAMTHVRLLDSNMILFGKIYGQWNNSWDGDLDMFYGLGYLGWDGSQGFFEPYTGLHNQSGDYVSARYGQTNGWNGYIVGWTAVLPFTLFDEKFILSSWDEIELDRNDACTEQQSGRGGLDDGSTVAWKSYSRWRVNVMWCCFDNKLGYDDFGDQMIYVLGYDF